VPAGLPAGLIGRRPDLIAAEARVAAAGFRVKEASASMYPRLSLTGQIGTTSNRPSDLTDLDFLLWTLAANLVAPLIDGGRLQGGLDLAIARETEVIADFAQTALQAFREVESLLAAEQHLRRRIGDLAAATEEATAARELSENRYRQGLGDYIAVLEAQRSALDLEGQLLDSRRALLDLRVDLHLALGGGFPPATAPAEGPTMPGRQDNP
jgi:outer membrane protein TolC